MVLASGSDLIDDVRRAPDDVLSGTEPMHEVHLPSSQSAHTHKDDLAPTTRIHAEPVEPERQLHYRRSSFQINAGYCRYFYGGSRRAHHGYE